jgi:hypothetical protein
MKKCKRRKVSDPPTELHHLNDAVVRKLHCGVEKALMKLTKATQPPVGVDFGTAFSSSVLMTITNVPRTCRNGGSSTQQLLNVPQIRIINPGGKRVLDLLHPAIHGILGDATNTSSPTLIDEQECVTHLTNHDQVEKDHEMADRRKATTLSVSENLADLDGKLKSHDDDNLSDSDY